MAMPQRDDPPMGVEGVGEGSYPSVYVALYMFDDGDLWW